MRVSCLLRIVFLVGTNAGLLGAQVGTPVTTNAPTADSFQLLMKSALPQFSLVNATFSPDEHYVALSGNSQIIVYDLRFALEVRRIDVTGGLGVFGSTLAFAHRSDMLYYQSGNNLNQCDLDSTDPCKLIRRDLTSAFVVSDNDQIAYVNTDGNVMLMNPRNPTARVAFPETIPKADRDDFSWFKLSLFESNGEIARIAATGSIKREVEVFDSKRNRNVKKSQPESHTSVFEVRSRSASAAYVNTPVDADEIVFDATGTLLICGPMLPNSDVDGTPSSVYDFNTRQIVADSELQQFSSSLLDVCLDKNPIASVYGGPVLGPNSSQDISNHAAWLSPSGKYRLSTDTHQDGEIILSLSFPQEKKAPVILAGSSEGITDIEFIPGHAALLTRGVMARHYWDFLGGQVSSFAADTHWNADATLGASFLLVGPGQGFDLYVQDMRSNQATKLPVHLNLPPLWLGISRSGNAVVYEESTSLSVYSNGTTTPIPCKWHARGVADFSISPSTVHPSIDPTGQVLSAFCERDDDDPASPGLSLYFVAWDLTTLKEFKPVPAHDFTNCGSVGPDGRSAVLCGRNKLRITDLDTGVSVDVSTDVSDLGESILDAQLQADGSTIALAINSYTTGSGRIEWFNRFTKHSLKASTAVPMITAFATDHVGNVAVTSNDNTTSVYAPNGARWIRFISVGFADWMTLADSGLFDGTSAALKWVAFRKSSNAQVVPAERLFNELYSPGLMQQSATGHAPQLIDGISMTALLELPGLRLLLEQGARPQIFAGKAVLCFDSDTLFTAIQNGQPSSSAFIVDRSQECGRRFVFSDQSHPIALVGGLGHLKSSHPQTPWDGQTLTDTGGTVYVLTVAVSKYSDPALRDVPTAVPATRNLAAIFQAHAAGSPVVDWSKNCGGLYDASATKPTILKCLDQMAAVVKPQDMVVLILAGHGGTGTIGTTQSELFYYYPAGYAASLQDLDGAISSVELADNIRRLSAKRLVVVVDACESGAVMDPIEGAAAAKIQQYAVLSASVGGPSDGGQSAVQGVLLITASSGIEDSVSGSTSNPFMDKLASILLPQDGEPEWSYAVATKMSEPISLPGQTDQPNEFTPVALTIGANFILTKP